VTYDIQGFVNANLVTGNEIDLNQLLDLDYRYYGQRILRIVLVASSAYGGQAQLYSDYQIPVGYPVNIAGAYEQNYLIGTGSNQNECGRDLRNLVIGIYGSVYVDRVIITLRSY
jgi:hypothetical protein